MNRKNGRISVLLALIVATILSSIGVGQIRRDQLKGGVTPPDVRPLPEQQPGPCGGAVEARNLLRNPGFERAGPLGSSAGWTRGMAEGELQSAAADWYMHTSNNRDTIKSKLTDTDRKDAGALMLAFEAGGNEGGIYQVFAQDNRGPRRVFASAWVFVKHGQVVIGTGNNGIITTAVSSKRTGVWEFLQVCSDGTDTNNWFIVYNQDPHGGAFLVDQVRVSRVQGDEDEHVGGMLIERINPDAASPGDTIEIFGRLFGHRQGTRIPAINLGRVNRLEVLSWSDQKIKARIPGGLARGTYRVLVYYNDSFRTSSNSLPVAIGSPRR